MIKYQKPYFCIETKTLSYAFKILETGHLEHLYFGDKLLDSDLEHLHTKLVAKARGVIDYLEDKPNDIPLDLTPLEYSSFGKGDFKLTPLEIKMPDQTFVSDFVYFKHEIVDGIIVSSQLPTPYDDDQNTKSLIVTLKDTKFNVYLDLVYTSFFDTDIITRKTVIRNDEKDDINIRKIMSMSFDIYGTNYDMLTLDGGAIKEAHKHITPIAAGTYINSSMTGNSSYRHNPGVILLEKGTHEDYGNCYGFNLIYSGNHYTAIDQSSHGILRVMQGINPSMFEIDIKTNEAFETPTTVLSFSSKGLNDLSHHMHDFINNHLIPRQFRGIDRPIVINSWEGFYFDFNERKLINLAKKAKSLGVELFVLDDGWFSSRNNDLSGLGDYDVNFKKLKHGLKGLSNKIHQMGMKFGLWFEPEMINPISKLYEKHPEYAIQIKGRTPAMGRHQLILDMINPDVRTYIVNQISNIIEDAKLDYIKWDMNRDMTDMFSSSLPNQGMFYHSYMLGLYDVLSQLRNKYPNILIETCASGGNRFDLGMLRYGPQIWTSDNTDPIARLEIQKGISYFYPLSCISNHVSMSPHEQTLRKTPIDTRFNVSMFGVLGYELDFKFLNSFEIKSIKEQIETYKTYRHVLQFGRFYRFNETEHIKMNFQASLEDTHIVGNYQILAEPSPNLELLKIKQLNPNKTYDIKSMKQQMPLDKFGHLISHALPIKLNPNKALFRLISKFKKLDNATEHAVLSGIVLMQGYKMKQQFMGTYYNDQVRILGDFSSQIYMVKESR
ncbi:MAG: alpha-galactosidase [Acholeplasmataceae bacterium]|nr:alpha-galactosidase [Acholeplasmataceae bacterium]